MNKNKLFIPIAIVVMLGALYFLVMLKNMDTLVCIGSTDWIIKTHSYENGTSIEKKFFYIILLEGNIIKFVKQEYSTNNENKLALNVKRDSDFIVSFHSNSTTAYDWQTDIGTVSVVNFIKYDYIYPDQSMFNLRVKEGESSRRKNFYYKAIKNGTSTLYFKYQKNGFTDSTDSHKIYIDIHVK